MSGRFAWPPMVAIAAFAACAHTTDTSAPPAEDARVMSKPPKPSG